VKNSFILLKAFPPKESVHWQFFSTRDLFYFIRKTWFTWNTCIMFL